MTVLLMVQNNYDILALNSDPLGDNKISLNKHLHASCLQA